MRWQRGMGLCAGSGGAVIAVAALHSLGDALASMMRYTAVLMGLGQVAAPLLLLGLGRYAQRSPFQNWWRDPLVALTAFVALSISVSVPQVLSRSLANALFSLPVGVLELLLSGMFWAQALPRTRRISSDLLLAAYLTLGNLPMMIVAVIWMTSPHLLYVPYLNIICLWNLTPLDDQHYAGFIMLASGLPLQVMAAWYLVAGLLPGPRAHAMPEG